MELEGITFPHFFTKSSLPRENKVYILCPREPHLPKNIVPKSKKFIFDIFIMMQLFFSKNIVPFLNNETTFPVNAHSSGQYQEEGEEEKLAMQGWQTKQLLKSRWKTRDHWNQELLAVPDVS